MNPQNVGANICERFGLRLEHTGGGCWAICGELGPVNYVSFSDEGMAIPTSWDEPVTIFVSRTREQMEDATAWDEGAIETRDFLTVTDAVAFLETLRSEV
jgi:hypothetical protein